MVLYFMVLFVVIDEYEESLREVFGDKIIIVTN